MDTKPTLSGNDIFLKALYLHSTTDAVEYMLDLGGSSYIPSRTLRDCRKG